VSRHAFYADGFLSELLQLYAGELLARSGTTRKHCEADRRVFAWNRAGATLSCSMNALLITKTPRRMSSVR